MKDILIKSYNRDAAIYDKKFKDFQFTKYKSLFDPTFIKSDAKPSIVDLGCGTALFKEYLVKSFYNFSYYGVDFSDGMINVASERSHNVVCSDIDNTPFKADTFDAAVCFTVLRLFSRDELSALTEFNRILKSNGILFISILKHKIDSSLYENFSQCGFDLLEERECGQDIGFICKKRGDKK